MGHGFLQGFYEDVIFAEDALELIQYHGYKQGLHIAMLGLADDAHSIFLLLHSHGLDPPTPLGTRAAIELFYLTSHLSSPFEFEELDAVAVQLAALRSNTKHVREGGNNTRGGLDLTKVTEQRFKNLQRVATGIATTQPQYANATLGHVAKPLSQTLAALTYMADQLDRQADCHNLLMTMANRIHANWQSDCLPLLAVAWRKLLHSRGLLRAMELTLPAVKDYAQFVLQTLERRLETGVVHADEVYKGKSMRELIAEMDHNTMTNTEFEFIDWGYDDDHPAPTTIYQEPASDEAIAAAEWRIGRELPEEFKEFLKITNGFGGVTVGPGTRCARFAPAEEMCPNGDGCFNGYGMTLLPGFSFDGDGRVGGDLDFRVADHEDATAFAMYEYDEQDTEYKWLVLPATVSAAKARIQEVYDKVGEEQKRKIDEAIVQRYRSREAYDGMEHCIYQQFVGAPAGHKVYVSFMSCLRGVVYESRKKVERSPVKVVDRQRL